MTIVYSKYLQIIMARVTKVLSHIHRDTAFDQPLVNRDDSKIKNMQYVHKSSFLKQPFVDWGDSC